MGQGTKRRPAGVIRPRRPNSDRRNSNHGRPHARHTPGAHQLCNRGSRRWRKRADRDGDRGFCVCRRCRSAGSPRVAAGHAGAMEPSARRLYQSIVEFKNQPDFMQILPGHGAGSACGKALGAIPSTTAGYERRSTAPSALRLTKARMPSSARSSPVSQSRQFTSRG